MRWGASAAVGAAVAMAGHTSLELSSKSVPSASDSSSDCAYCIIIQWGMALTRLLSAGHASGSHAWCSPASSCMSGSSSSCSRKAARSAAETRLLARPTFSGFTLEKSSPRKSGSSKAAQVVSSRSARLEPLPPSAPADMCRPC